MDPEREDAEANVAKTAETKVTKAEVFLDFFKKTKDSFLVDGLNEVLKKYELYLCWADAMKLSWKVSRKNITSLIFRRNPEGVRISWDVFRKPEEGLDFGIIQSFELIPRPSGPELFLEFEDASITIQAGEISFDGSAQVKTSFRI